MMSVLRPSTICCAAEYWSAHKLRHAVVAANLRHFIKSPFPTARRRCNPDSGEVLPQVLAEIHVSDQSMQVLVSTRASGNPPDGYDPMSPAPRRVQEHFRVPGNYYVREHRSLDRIEERVDRLRHQY